MSVASDSSRYGALGAVMIIVSESVCEKIFGADQAFEAVESVFGSMARGDARNFPVVREALGHADALYGFKSGFDQSSMALGVKSGGYWPNNAAQSLTNHQSTIFLFDPDTGQINAAVGGNYLTAIRTAAASAVSIKHLSRPDSEVIGMIGAGHQSSFQLRAAVAVGNFKKLVAWNLEKDKMRKIQATAQDLGLEYEVVDRPELCAQADVIITITSAHEALLLKDWVKPGTHLACMGTDTRGKQEIDPEIIATATVFTDEIEQSISIGETQHAFDRGLITANDITPIGDVINGRHPGRSYDLEITLFDGTGVGLQDIATASKVVSKAKSLGVAVSIDL